MAGSHALPVAVQSLERFIAKGLVQFRMVPLASVLELDSDDCLPVL